MTDADVATTHAEGCWAWGPKHHACAVREIEQLRARVAEMERDARLGAVVRKAVGCMNAHMIEGHTTSPGFTHRQERIISVHQLNVLRAIADALRAEEGGEQ